MRSGHQVPAPTSPVVAGLWLQAALGVHRLDEGDARAEPGASLANSLDVARPAPRARTLTPMDAGGSIATNNSATTSLSTSLVSSEPLTSQVLREINRFSQNMSSMDIGDLDGGSLVGSAPPPLFQAPYRLYRLFGSIDRTFCPLRNWHGCLVIDVRVLSS